LQFNGKNMVRYTLWHGSAHVRDKKTASFEMFRLHRHYISNPRVSKWPWRIYKSSILVPLFRDKNKFWNDPRGKISVKWNSGIKVVAWGERKAIPLILNLIKSYFCNFVIFIRKKLSVCHKLWFSNSHIFTTQCHRP